MMSDAALPAVSPLGEHSIEDMLGALRRAATSEAIGLEQLEVWAATNADPVFTAAVTDVRRHGAALGATHALLMALAPHLTAIEALIRSRR
jgi:hypothetical protein